MDSASGMDLYWQLARLRRWTFVALLLSGLPLSSVSRAASVTPISRECEIKAAFIYNFTKFVEWPVGGLADHRAPFVIGVLGDSGCDAALERLASDHQINGHPIEVHKVASAQEVRSVQILYVSRTQEQQFAALASAITVAPVLTVGESATFVSAGGMVNFVQQDNKLRFEINVHSATQAGLRVSAQVLKLATSVRESS